MLFPRKDINVAFVGYTVAKHNRIIMGWIFAPVEGTHNISHTKCWYQAITTDKHMYNPFECKMIANYYLLSPSDWQQVEEQAPKPVGWMMCFLLMTFVPVQMLCVNIYIYIYAGSIFLYEFTNCFTNCVLLSDDYSLIPGCLWLLTFVLNNTLIFRCSTIPHLPGCFLSLDLLSEYRIQHGAIGPFMSHLATQLEYSAGEFRALQLIVLATFRVVD